MTRIRRILYTLLTCGIMLIGLLPLATESVAAGSDVIVGFRQARGTATDVVAGTIYHRPDVMTLIRIYDPIRQWMKIDAAQVTIYYPDERRALRLLGSNPYSLLAFQFFLNISNANVNLEGLGFQLATSEIRGDSLITYWDPPVAEGNEFGNALLVYHEDFLVSWELYNKKDQLLERIAFADYVESGGSAYPLRVELTRSGPAPYSERTDFASPQFVRSLPDSILAFRVPAGIPIEDLN